MRVLKFSSLLLCSLCFIVKGDAQSREPAEKPVWAMEFLEVQPGKMALALGYLDDHWMRVREEAKRQGVVLNYHRVSEVRLEIDGPLRPEELYKTVDTRVFMEQPANPDTAQFKLIH